VKGKQKLYISESKVLARKFDCTDTKINVYMQKIPKNIIDYIQKSFICKSCTTWSEQEECMVETKRKISEMHC
jgi:hypothetical protein